MPEVVGKLYVQSKFSPEAKEEVQDLARRLMIVFNESLHTFEWMDNATRAAAETKLAKMSTKIGYPDWLFNETYIEGLHKFVPHLSVDASYGEMMYALSQNRWKQEMLRLRKPYNKDTEWSLSPAVVNAFYSPTDNEMVFPSGILRGVFYGRGLPRSINFGAIGTVVGHEMTHGFDDTGSQFDADGALKQWWTNETRAKFMEKAKCFEYEYGSIKDVEANMTLNGENTLDENIADNGGLRLAFEAYKELLKVEYKNVDTRLKDLEELSGEQLFFIANAMSMCSRSRPEHLKEQIHVNVPLSNLPAFSHTFKCPPNSTMNRTYRCAIWSRDASPKPRTTGLHVNLDLFGFFHANGRTYNARTYNVCATPACVQRAQVIRDSLNTSVDPCTDFYAYACGGWMAKHEIPESQSTTSSFSLVEDELRETLRDILGNMTIVEERQSVTDKAAVVYKACLAVPRLEDRPDVMLANGIGSVFSFHVARDVQKLTSYAIQLDQTFFTMVDRNEIINQTTEYSEPIIDAYRNVIKVAMRFMKPGLTDDEITVLIDTLLAFEGKLASVSLLRNKFRLANITLAENETVELIGLEYYRRLNTFLGSADVDTLFNYAGLRRMLKWAAAVSHDFREAAFELRRVKEGVRVERPRWQLASSALEAKHEVQDIARRLMIVFNESLQTFEWMDNATRTAAETKLAKMSSKIGYPDWLFNETYIEGLYRFVPQLSVNASYGEMMYALSENHGKQELLKLRKPYNKDTEWALSPAFVSAFYSPSDNEMVFPSGILQGVFYGQGLPRSINFGAIGTLVGHEMTHGFDDSDGQFDADGALKQWWTNDTRAKFMEKAKCFEHEYGSIQDMETNMTLNGESTLGENIADNGGLRLAFEAYKELLQVEYNNVDTRLKDLEEFSGEQLFFIAKAMTMCSRSRPEHLKEQIQYDPHVPSQYGVNVPLSNLPAFSDTFNCPANSIMNRQHRCAIW
ncbi:hypothetical protein MTO96_004951 [Rhipicephalus appendiculatus]